MELINAFETLCFNTSHVTLYLRPVYIMHYILKSFNTSHVTLYQFLLKKNNMRKNSFNTSHVTLYLRWIVIYALFLHVSIHHMLLFIFDNKSKCTCEIVSIHHMLLFITDQFFLVRIILLFQYITCYSLSMSI